MAEQVNQVGVSHHLDSPCPLDVSCARSLLLHNPPLPVGWPLCDSLSHVCPPATHFSAPSHPTRCWQPAAIPSRGWVSAVWAVFLLHVNLLCGVCRAGVGAAAQGPVQGCCGHR